VNRMQLERGIADAQKAQDVLRQDNDKLVAENARVKKTAQTTYAEARALNRASSKVLAAIQRDAVAAGLLNQETMGVASQARSLQSSALAALLRLEQQRTVRSCPPRL